MSFWVIYYFTIDFTFKNFLDYVHICVCLYDCMSCVWALWGQEEDSLSPEAGLTGNKLSWSPGRAARGS